VTDVKGIAPQFMENEEKWEKKVEEKMGTKATATDAKAAKVDKSFDATDMPVTSSTGTVDDVLLDDIPEGEIYCTVHMRGIICCNVEKPFQQWKPRLILVLQTCGVQQLHTPHQWLFVHAHGYPG